MRLYSEVDIAKQRDKPRKRHQFGNQRPVCPNPALIPGQQNAGHQDDGQIGETTDRLILEDVLQVTVGIVVSWDCKTAPLTNSQERIEWGSHKQHGYQVEQQNHDVYFWR